MKLWLIQVVRRMGFGEADLPGLGVLALSAAAILAAAGAGLAPVPLHLAVPG